MNTGNFAGIRGQGGRLCGNGDYPVCVCGGGGESGGKVPI